jgi:hypothetical protein
VFNHVLDKESLDCLVLWYASCAIGASDGFDVSTTRLVSSSVSSLGGHFFRIVSF